MMKRVRKLGVFGMGLAALAAASCATSGKQARVVENEGGTLSAVGIAKSEADARVAALDEATDHCEDQKKRAIFREEELARKSGKVPDIDISKIPVIGKVLRGDDKSEVILDFRCG